MVHHEDSVVPPPALMTRVSWGAIFAGALAAIGLTALLSLLGLGIGFGTFDPADGDSLSGVPKTTLIWWAVVSIVATGIGGFVAARLAGIPHSLAGALHGLSVWALTSLATLWLATTAVGAIAGAATSLVSTTARISASAIGTTVGAVADAGGAIAPDASQAERALAMQGVTRDRVRSEAAAILSGAGIGAEEARQTQQLAGQTARNMLTEPGSAGAELNRFIDRMFEGPQAVLSEQERRALVTEISNRAGVSRPEAEQIASRWQSQAQAAATQVRESGATAADRLQSGATDVSQQAMSILSKIAWGMFLISLAGLVAAMIGAALGAPSLESAARIGGARLVDD